MNRDMKEMVGFVRTPQFLMSYHAPPTHHNNNNISPQQKYVVFRENTFWEKNGPINGNNGHEEKSPLVPCYQHCRVVSVILVGWMVPLPKFCKADCKQHFKFLGVRSAEQWAEAHQRTQPLQLNQRFSKPPLKVPIKNPIKSLSFEQQQYQAALWARCFDIFQTSPKTHWPLFYNFF